MFVIFTFVSHKYSAICGVSSQGQHNLLERNLGPQGNTVYTTSENCGEINNSGFIAMRANGFRNDPQADNMVQMPSPSVSLLSREIGLYHFLFLSLYKRQVPHAVCVLELQRLACELMSEPTLIRSGKTSRATLTP